MKSPLSVLSVALFRRPMGFIGVVVVGLSCFVGAPAARAAASWYAGPHGAGSTCTETAPCELQTAINFASAGDDVYAIADQGDYSLSSTVHTLANTAIQLHGLNGRPRLIFSNGQLYMNGGTIEGFYVEGHSDFTAFGMAPGAVADRMFVKQASASHACYMEGATLTNSVCWAGPSGDIAIETDSSNTLRNVSAIGGRDMAILMYGRDGCSCTYTDTLTNVIARSAQSGSDLVVNSDGTATAVMGVTYSNFGTTKTLGSGSPSMTHVNGDATDQTAAPLFVNASAGDFHEASGSPTIDAGMNDSANGSLDLDGNSRVVNGQTDIGAYEAQPIPPAPDTTITKATIKSAKHLATFQFEATGSSTGFECARSKIKNGKPGPLTFSSCISPKTYKHLKSGRYLFEVRAIGPGGADQTPAAKRFKISA